MYGISHKLRMEVNNAIYLKDPASSDLGRRIISGGIDLIAAIGFDELTFRKLAKHIQSTEASIYRYFENKYMLLIYLTAWYWGWMEYQLTLAIANVPSPEQRLYNAIKLLTEQVSEGNSFGYIDQVKLHSIIISESSKSYLIKKVDQINQEGAYLGYKQCVGIVSDIVLEINKDFQYPHMLISTVIEGAHLQRYFIEHLPRLSDNITGEDSVVQFYLSMVFSTIQPECKHSFNLADFK